MKVFLSHAAVDKPIADLLCSLLCNGLNIVRKNIFCSSLPGQSIPGGFDFIKHIKEQFEAAEIVIILFSQNYLDSQFCLAELGACWICNKRHIPLVVPPLKYRDLKATLSVTQAHNITKDDELDLLADDLFTEGYGTIAQWGNAKTNFLSVIYELVDAQPAPKRVFYTDFENLQNRYNDLLDESKQMAKRLLEKDSYIEELKKCKNKSDVVQLDIKLSGEKEQFDCFCDNLRHALWDVPPVVRTTFYYSNKGESLPLPVYGEDDKWSDIREACDQKFIEYEQGESVVLNDEHPIVKKIQKSLAELSDFINNCSPEFYDAFTEKHDFLLNLEDKNFWDNFLS